MRNSIFFVLGACLMLIACGQQNQKETNMDFTDHVKMALADSGRISLDSLQWTREPTGFEVKGDTIRITHRFPLERIAEAYELFEQKRDGVIKVAITQ